MNQLIGKDRLDLIVDTIKRGGLVAFPTETVYGIGVVYDNFDAYKRLKLVKKRPEDKPFTLMVSSFEMLLPFIKITDYGRKLMKLMPGEVTLLFEKADGVDDYITNGLSTIGVRMPNDPFILSVISQVGKPLLVPSANISGEAPATTSQEVSTQLSGLDLIVKGNTISKIPSTIIDTRNCQIIREGLISKVQVEEVLK